MEQHTEGWEEDFLLKRVTNQLTLWKEEEPTCWHPDWKAITDFIRSLLASHDAEIEKALDKEMIDITSEISKHDYDPIMKRDATNEMTAYNNGLKRAKSLIKQRNN